MIQLSCWNLVTVEIIWFELCDNELSWIWVHCHRQQYSGSLWCLNGGPMVLKHRKYAKKIYPTTLHKVTSSFWCSVWTLVGFLDHIYINLLLSKANKCNTVLFFLFLPGSPEGSSRGNTACCIMIYRSAWQVKSQPQSFTIILIMLLITPEDHSWKMEIRQSEWAEVVKCGYFSLPVWGK